LRSNTKGCASKTHYTDSQNSDTTASWAESCTICSSGSERPVRELLDTLPYSLRMQTDTKFDVSIYSGLSVITTCP